MYCLELIKFDISNTSCYVAVENGALLREVARSWKTILGGHGKSRKESVETLFQALVTTEVRLQTITIAIRKQNSPKPCIFCTTFSQAVFYTSST